MRVAVVGAGHEAVVFEEGRGLGGQGDERGNTHGAADAVIVTAPAPQAADPLARSPEGGARVEALRREAVKGRPSADGVEPVVARLDPEASAALLDAPDEDAPGVALPALAARRVLA